MRHLTSSRMLCRSGFDISTWKTVANKLIRMNEKLLSPLFSNEDPDAWSLIGNLHLAKMEWGPGEPILLSK